MSKKATPGYGRILDAWVRPKDAGDPIGCVATTFTFSASFFEEECLSRFLQFDSDPLEDGPVYLIERDSKLSQLECASVLVDQHYCTGTRSLRWDLLSARIPQAILHAKVSLLRWSNIVRLIISSANLAQDGYRRNQEIFGLLDYFSGSEAPLTCLHQTIDFLRKTVNYASTDPTHPALKRWKDFLQGIAKVTQKWGQVEQFTGTKKVRVYPVFSGPGHPALPETLRSLWPESSPSWAQITSTYFDLPGKENKPAKEIWRLLKQKGEACVTYYISAEDQPDGKSILLNAPESLLKAQPTNRTQVNTVFRRIRHSTNIQNEEEAFRPLHLKSIALDSDRWQLYMIGSSNFSSIGLGYLAHSNVEANLAYIANKNNLAAQKDFKRAFFEGEDIDEGLKWIWQPLRDAEADASMSELLLPLFFNSAVFAGSYGQYVIRFGFGYAPPTGWSICSDSDQDVIYDEVRWNNEGCPLNVELTWMKDRPPSGFQITWYEAGGSVWWPVNLESYMSLPPAPELRNLPLDLLLRVYTSARPPYQIIGQWLKKKLTEGDPAENPSLDPHKRVDTSAFLLQRTRKLSWLFRSLKDRLERPVPTRQALEWRLRGPVGVTAISGAIAREAKSELEKSFLMAELALELQRVQPKNALGHLRPADVKEEILKIVEELRDQLSKDSLARIPLMKQYVERAFPPYPSEI